MFNDLSTALQATDRPHPALDRTAAEVFGRFVGCWSLDCVFTAADGTQSTTAGEWHFGWILGGRAVQDVTYFYPRGQRPASPSELRGGTNVRLYDPKAGQWQVSWFAAVSGNVIHLRGGAVGDRIVLLGTDVDGAALRWSFNEIRLTSFRWLGETSNDAGATWRIEQEMRVVRQTPGEVS